MKCILTEQYPFKEVYSLIVKISSADDDQRHTIELWWDKPLGRLCWLTSDLKRCKMHEP